MQVKNRADWEKRSPLSRRRFALDRNAIEEEEEEGTDIHVKDTLFCHIKKN